MTPGAQVRAIREAAGLTQVALGSMLGVPQSAISKRERGEVDLRVSDLIATAEACGVALLLGFVPRSDPPANVSFFVPLIQPAPVVHLFVPVAGPRSPA